MGAGARMLGFMLFELAGTGFEAGASVEFGLVEPSAQRRSCLSLA
jgi:hypothetical protein